MAIVNPTIWQMWSKITVTGDALAQVSAICTQVDAAIKSYLKRNLEKKTYTGLIFSAPRTPTLGLFKYTPIDIASFQLYLNWEANGNPAAFDSTTLQVPYVNYLLQPSEDDPTISDSGVVTYLGQVPWGVDYYLPPYSVSFQRVDVPGAISINLTGGYDIIPADITLAACLTVSKIRQMGRYGMMEAGESWNGYSYNLPSSLFQFGIIGDPQIKGLLDPYTNYSTFIG